ncbi:hypothetical protein CGRA01v4_02924 [Colletotrichum graminicola]|nr:hypothetical protein CGRA01v4_02924 [Colletotrichum graminicola]
MYLKHMAPAWPKVPFISLVLLASSSLQRYRPFLPTPRIGYKYLCNGTSYHQCILQSKDMDRARWETRLCLVCRFFY